MSIMNTFEKNYWSLYLDFLKDFKELTYRGFSIPHFCIYPKIVNKTKNRWNTLLFDKKLTRQLKHQVKDKKEIQEEFNKFIQAHTKKSLVKNKHGKVVLHTDSLLRFPEETFNDYFDPSSTVILSSFKGSPENRKLKSKKKSKARIKTNTLIVNRKKRNITKNIGASELPKTNIPIDYLSKYSNNTEKAITQVQNKARALFRSNNKHPLYGDGHFQHTFLMQIPQIINRIEEAKNFLEKVSVSCIVISNPHFVNRILALTAAEKGVPTVCMQHGLVGKGYLPKIATIDAVYGNFEKDWYKKAGVSEDSLEIIGHPKFDQILNRTAISRSAFNKQFGLDASKKTLMVTVRENYDMEDWRLLIKTISDKYELNILIRDYPGRETNTLSKEFPFVHATKNYHLYDILPNVDAVVAYPSTVGLEAMLANKPAFILERGFSGESGLQNQSGSLPVIRSLIRDPHYTGYFNGLDEMVQENPKKLGELIINYFNDANWESYAKKKRDNFLPYAYSDYKMSGERLINLINRLSN